MSVLKGSVAWSWIEFELKYEKFDSLKPELSSNQILVFDLNNNRKKMKINFKWLLYKNIRLLNVYEKHKMKAYIFSSSIGDCDERCENDTRCKAFSFGNLECHLSEFRIIENYKYIGCFNDNHEEKDDESYRNETMTINMCYEYCLKKFSKDYLTYLTYSSFYLLR